jgi:hypothetical protein
MDSLEDYNNLLNRLRAKFTQIISFHSDINRRNEWIIYSNTMTKFYQNQFNNVNQQFLISTNNIFNFEFKDGKNRPTEQFNILSNLDYTDPILIRFIGDLMRN